MRLLGVLGLARLVALGHHFQVLDLLHEFDGLQLGHLEAFKLFVVILEVVSLWILEIGLLILFILEVLAEGQHHIHQQHQKCSRSENHYYKRAIDSGVALEGWLIVRLVP
uniref:Uncharacterized protein n=1 Tax=Strombidium inclinatum TaxID=197538 RepID=A0A7S3IPT4_9SPIT